jgi:hypothetical protein
LSSIDIFIQVLLNKIRESRESSFERRIFDFGGGGPGGEKVRGVREGKAAALKAREGCNYKGRWSFA